MNKDIFLTIGNTDNKLSQKDWQQFQKDFKQTAESLAEKVWGVWYSDPKTPYQNMCIGILLSESNVKVLEDHLRELAIRYKQNSIAWSDAKTRFISPK